MENCCEDKVKYKKTPRTKEDVSKLKNRLKLLIYLVINIPD